MTVSLWSDHNITGLHPADDFDAIIGAPQFMHTVIESECTGCELCVAPCPVDCIAGEKKELHVIDTDACIRCGVCRDKCKFDAVHVV